MWVRLNRIPTNLTFEPMSFGDSNDVDHLVHLEHLLDRNRSLQVPPGPVHLQQPEGEGGGGGKDGEVRSVGYQWNWVWYGPSQQVCLH